MRANDRSGHQASIDVSDFSASELLKAALDVLWDTAGTQWEALGREMASR